MRKFVHAISTLIVIAVLWSCNDIDKESEKKAIISVIERETQAYYDRDIEERAKTLLQDESLIVLVANNDKYGYAVGYNQVYENSKIAFGRNPEQITDKFENKDYKIEVYKSSARVVYDEYVYDSKGDFKKKVINVRFLEKVDDTWRIAYLGDVTTSSYD
ncbi:MAG: hypothetical protein ABFS38_09540 [Bacteroidota bacterium]